MMMTSKSMKGTNWDWLGLPALTVDEIKERTEELREDIVAAGWDDAIFYQIKNPMTMDRTESVGKFLNQVMIPPPRKVSETDFTMFEVPEGVEYVGIPTYFSAFLKMDFSFPFPVVVTTFLTPVKIGEMA